MDGLEFRDEVGEKRAEQLATERAVELRAPEQVEGEGLRREQVSPQALLLDERAVLAVGGFAPHQLCDLGGQEVDAGPRDFRREPAAEGASPSFLGFDLAHREATSLPPDRLQEAGAAGEPGIVGFVDVEAVQDVGGDDGDRGGGA